MMGSKHLLANGLLCVGLLSLVFAAPAQAIPTLAAPPPANPPANLQSTAGPLQIAIPDTATIVATAGLQPILQATLDMQGFSNANNWFMVGNAVPLGNTVFTLTTYNLALNPVTVSYPTPGTAFGEQMNFNLSANPPQPAIAGGQVATLHWLQLLNENWQYNSGAGAFGYQVPGYNGYWQLDNGDLPGGPANGAAIKQANGPYYDSNNGPGGAGQLPPNFGDFPKYYAGYGTYLHFDAIPVWDIYTPAVPNVSPATDSIDIGDYGLAWGFSIVPEPSSIGLLILAGSSLALRRRRAVN